MVVSRRAGPDDIAAIALALPEVSESTSWGGLRSFTVRGKAFVTFRGPRPDAVDEDGRRLTDVVVIHCAASEKQAMVDDPELPFFTTPHFDGYHAVLVRLSHLDRMQRDELAEVITDAWLARAPKRLARQWLIDHPGETGRSPY